MVKRDKWWYVTSGAILSGWLHTTVTTTSPAPIVGRFVPSERTAPSLVAAVVPPRGDLLAKAQPTRAKASRTPQICRGLTRVTTGQGAGAVRTTMGLTLRLSSGFHHSKSGGKNWESDRKAAQLTGLTTMVTTNRETCAGRLTKSSATTVVSVADTPHKEAGTK
jgi:hypothetical protein